MIWYALILNRAVLKNRIYYLLDKKGWNLAQLKNKAGLSEGLLYNYPDLSLWIPSGKVLNKLCKVFDCQPGDILSYKPDLTDEE